jgi:hypothetical protein
MRRSPDRSPLRTLALRAAAVALAGSQLTACRSVEDTWGVPPIFEVYPTPSSKDWARSPLDGLAPAEGTETFLRPFFGYETIGDDAWRLRILPPFVDLKSWRDGSEYRVLPIFRRAERRAPDGKHDIDGFLFPIFFWGDDSDEGSYFAVFPFGGRLRGLLAVDVADFVLFPIWLSTRSDDKRSLHVLWPFYNAVEGGGWSGWRIWPFWGHYEQQNEDGTPRAERSFTVWPFWIRIRDQLHRDPTEATFVFPFYGIRENSRSLTETFLWPFYVRHFDKRKERTLHGGYFFPYRFTEGQADYWPIWGVKRSLESEEGSVEHQRYRQFFLWPIERYEWSSNIREETKRFWILPFFWHFSIFDKRDLRVESHWKLWPLVGSTAEGDHRALDIFSPLWFSLEPYERHYGRLFAIFRYRSKPDFHAWELLWGSIYWERRGGDPLFSLLGGLLEVGRNADGIRWRFLYIPWW